MRAPGADLPRVRDRVPGGAAGAVRAVPGVYELCKLAVPVHGEAVALCMNAESMLRTSTRIKNS